MTTISNLINLFLSGAEEGVTGTKSIPGNLKIRGNKLIHYHTVISERKDPDTFIVNLSQYSIQTGRVQKQLKEALHGKQYIIVKKVPRDYDGTLQSFVKGT